MLTTRTNVEYCITHFIAFEIVAHIGSIYVENLSDFALKHETHHHPLADMRRSSEIPFTERSFGHKILRIIYKCIKVFFNAFYYYFVSYMVILIPFIFNLSYIGKKLSHSGIYLENELIFSSNADAKLFTPEASSGYGGSDYGDYGDKGHLLL